jgi:hypothetical protein
MPKIVNAFIYYVNDKTVPDHAFERAAKSEASRFESDYVEFIPVTTKADFFQAWDGINQQARLNNAEVGFVGVFSHALKEENDETDNGLEFARDSDGGENTLIRADILKLSVLPWKEGARLHLFSCNSGLTGERDWNPAQAFFQRQGVTTSGERGWSYFSKQRDTYKMTDEKDTQLYLHAYRRMRNDRLGDRIRILPKVYSNKSLTQDEKLSFDVIKKGVPASHSEISQELYEIAKDKMQSVMPISGSAAPSTEKVIEQERKIELQLEQSSSAENSCEEDLTQSTSFTGLGK